MSNTIPRAFKNTRTVRKIRKYMDTEFTEVLHTTLNPNGPGAIRIHLIPPKKEEDAFNPSIAIINGTDILPVNFVWAVMLAELIKETNRFDGKEISEVDIWKILARATGNVRNILPFFSRSRIKGDMETIYTTIKQIAFREEVTTDVHFMSIGDYAPFMKAPHRMDLMQRTASGTATRNVCTVTRPGRSMPMKPSSLLRPGKRSWTAAEAPGSHR